MAKNGRETGNNSAIREALERAVGLIKAFRPMFAQFPKLQKLDNDVEAGINYILNTYRDIIPIPSFDILARNSLKEFQQSVQN